MELAALSPLGPLLEFETRFLWPFFFAAGAAEPGAHALAQASPAGEPGLWQPAAASTAYQDELLPHVGHFFFSNNDGGRYLRVAADTADAWFKRTVIDLDAAPRSRLALAPTPGIELFLTNWGVGVLSIALTSPNVSDPLTHADFDYRLSRLHGGGAPLLRTADVWPEFLRRQLLESSRQSQRYRENLAAQLRAAEERWQAMPPAQRETIEKARQEFQHAQGRPDDPATPVAKRLGSAGGAFTLPEFRDFLLAPLAAFGRRPAQDNFCVYTVARFGESVDFNDHAARRAGALLISRLAQVEERHHAGTLNDEVCVPAAILNPRHYAAAGLLGSAHLVADQPPEPDGASIAFNEQRLPRVRDKYFVPYLLALVQTYVLQHTADEAALLIRQVDREHNGDFDRLCQRFREFSVGGNFSRASSRAALHRYYQVARQGLDVPANWNDARQALGDLDTKFEAETQRNVLTALQQSSAQQTTLAAEQSHLAASMDQSLHQMIRLQLVAKKIEVFIISVYLAHLTHMLWPGVYSLITAHWNDAHAIVREIEEERHSVIGGEPGADGHGAMHAPPAAAAAPQTEQLVFEEAVHTYHEREQAWGSLAVVTAALTSLALFWYFIVMRHPPEKGNGHGAPH